MDHVFSHMLWQPFKSLGRSLKFMDRAWVMVCMGIVVIAAMVATHVLTLSPTTILVIGTLSCLVSLLCYVRAFSTKYSAFDSWNQVMLGHMFSILFLSLFSSEGVVQLLLFIAGILVAFVGGHLCMYYLARRGETLSLDDFHGHIYEYGHLGNLFLLLSLAYMAFPITPSFLGEEILLSSIHMDQSFLIVLFGMGYLFQGISITRIFTKLFFGPHRKTYHEIAYKSA